MAYEQDEIQHVAMFGNSQAAKLQLVIAKNLGDSRLIENTHQHGRDLFRSSKASSFSNPTIFANAFSSGALEERQTPCVRLQESDKAQAKPFNSALGKGINKQLRSQGHKLPKEMQRMMVPKSPAHTWPSPAPASLFVSAASTAWLFAFYGSAEDDAMRTQGVGAAWLSCLASAGCLVAQKSTSRLVKVMASAEWAFLGIDVLVEVDLFGNRSYVCARSRGAVQWHHVFDLDDWLVLQVEPCLLNQQGPLGWKTLAEPLPLECLCCLDGAALTFLQLKKLIRYFGGTIRGNPSKKSLQIQIIEMLLGEEDQVQAKANIPEEKRGRQAKDDWDSDLSEVVSELGHDEGNAQDLKEFKDKKKARKVQKKLEGGDEVVDGKKKKGKGKGRGKGKGKGRGQGKGKGKGKKKKKVKNFFSSLLNRAQQQRMKELAQEEEQEGQQAQPEAMEVEDLEGVGGKADQAEDIAMPQVEVEDEGKGESPGAEGGEAEVEAAQEVQVDEPARASGEAAGPSRPEIAEPAGPSRPEPAASSNAPPPQEDEPPAKKKKFYKSPDEVLEKLGPPGAKMTLSFMDHRWKVRWLQEEPLLEGDLKQLSFSRSFGTKKTWGVALKEVHTYAWKKWDKLKQGLPLPAGQESQVGKEIPQDILDELKHSIGILPPVTRY